MQAYQLVALLMLAMTVVPLVLAVRWLQVRVALVFAALALASLATVLGASRDLASALALPGRVGVALLGLRLVTLERRHRRA